MTIYSFSLVGSVSLLLELANFFIPDQKAPAEWKSDMPDVSSSPDSKLNGCCKLRQIQNLGHFSWNNVFTSRALLVSFFQVTVKAGLCLLVHRGKENRLSCHEISMWGGHSTEVAFVLLTQQPWHLRVWGKLNNVNRTI